MQVVPGIDQLCGDADPVAQPPDAPFQHITDAQLATDLPRVDRLVSVGERVLREITSIPAIRDRSVVRSSVIPSPKYCCSGSLLRLVKGSTTIDRRGATGGWEVGAANGTRGTGGWATGSGRHA